jgi:hypothetical protein
LESTASAPPGHLPSENLDPALKSYQALSTSTSQGKICSAVTAASLSAIPIPASLISGAATCTDIAYSASNSLLDVIVSGCRAAAGIVVIMNPTQPDVFLSGSAICPLTADPVTHKVNVGTACLAADGYSSYFQFTADRVIVK